MIDQYEHWTDIVSGGNVKAIEDMTFLEFMAKLDREIEHREREAQAYNERLNATKRK